MGHLKNLPHGHVPMSTQLFLCMALRLLQWPLVQYKPSSPFSPSSECNVFEQGQPWGAFLFFFPIFVLSLFEKHRGNDAVWHPLLLEHCPGTWLVISTPLSPSVAFEYQNSFAIGRIFTHFDSSYHVELSNWVKEPRALEAHRAWVCMAPVRHSQHLCT